MRRLLFDFDGMSLASQLTYVNASRKLVPSCSTRYKEL
jgi:hypothetical protein